MPQQPDHHRRPGYGPRQLADRLGLAAWQLARALDQGLLPPPGPDGRWPPPAVEAAAARTDQLRAQVGALPDVGAWRAAEVLADRFALDVDAGAVAELARAGLLPQAGHYKGNALYDGRALERLGDRAAVQRAARQGRLRTADEAAAYLGVRRSDLDHLVRAGRLAPATWGRSRWQARRAAPRVALYRTGDLDALATDPAIDWPRVRATPPGRPSALARLAPAGDR
jgi:hypothetical protein